MLREAIKGSFPLSPLFLKWANDNGQWRRSLVAFLTFEQSPVNFISPLPISFQPTFNLSANVIILAWRWANKRVRRQRPLSHSFTRVWLLNLLLSPSLPLSLSGATTDRHMLDIHERRADAYIHKHPRPPRSAYVDGVGHNVRIRTAASLFPLSRRGSCRAAPFFAYASPSRHLRRPSPTCRALS